MVVRKDVVAQIDENRGELTRTEFVNLLIQKQLKEFYEKPDYVTREELAESTRAVQQVLHNFLEFFLTYRLLAEQPLQPQAVNNLHDQVSALDNPTTTDDEED